MFEESAQLEFDEECAHERFSVSNGPGIGVRLNDSDVGESYPVETIDDALTMMAEIIDEEDESEEQDHHSH